MKVDLIPEIIETHVQNGAEERQRWSEYHAAYLSEYWHADGEERYHPHEREGENSDLTMESNYAYAYIDTMIANICPTNPAITINAQQRGLENIARAREYLANDTIRRDKLHAKGWDLAVFTGITGRGISKTVWSPRKRRPEARLIHPRNFFWDRSNEWEDIQYTIEAVPITRGQFESRMKKNRTRPPPGQKVPPKYKRKAAEQAQFNRYPQWLIDPTRNESNDLAKASRDIFEWTIVYEVYDFVNGKFYHFLDGVQEPLLETELPYEFVGNPYDLTTFNTNLEDPGGVSDIKLIWPGLELLNEVDTLELWFSRTCIPVLMANRARVDDPEEFMSMLTNATGPGAVAWFSAKQVNAVITDIIQWSQTPQLSPSWDKMRERIVQNIEFILGIPQYSRGVIGGADVATEVALADTATRTRNGRRIRIMNEWIQSVSKKYIGLWGQFMTPERQLYVRDPAADEAVDLDVEVLGFIDRDSFEDEWYYQFEAVPYSPTENHRLVQLQKLQQYMQFLMQNPAVDQPKLTRKLVEMLALGDILNPGGGAQPVAAPGAAPPGQPGAGPQSSGTSADTIMSGALPEGENQAMEAILPPGARSQASQPRV